MVAALRAVEAESVEQGVVDAHEIKAVFKVWKYRDDVHIMIIPDQSQSKLYIRSASREGFSDLGVNKRRVRKILKAIATEIKS